MKMYLEGMSKKENGEQEDDDTLFHKYLFVKLPTLQNASKKMMMNDINIDNSL